MDNHIKIIGCLQKGVFSGQISYNDGPYSKISIGGEEKISWSQDMFSQIRDNEQIDTKNTVCQCILVSDQCLDSESFFTITKSNPWEWDEVVKAVDVTTLRPVKWKLDGLHLEENINRSLPNVHNGKLKEGFLYTYPKITPPKNAKPWSNSQQTCVKKESVSSEHSPKEIQRLAVKKQPEPQPENSSNVYDALREIANSPKNK